MEKLTQENHHVLQVAPEHKRLLVELLQHHLPGIEVWAYGSRVSGKAKPWSDLDLVVFAGPDQRARVEALREALEESDLPFRVDLFVWDELPESFRENIRRARVVLQQGRRRSPAGNAPPALETGKSRQRW